MPSSSKLVNTSEAFELRLVHYLGNHDATSPFVLECESLMNDGNVSALLNTIFNDSSALNVLFDQSRTKNNNNFSFTSNNDGNSNEEDGVHAFTLLCALLDSIDDNQERKDVMNTMVKKIEDYNVDVTVKETDKSGDETEKSTLGIVVDKKLKMLCALYNLRHDGAEKCWILSRILHTCAFGGDDETVLSLLPGRDSALGTLLEKNNLGTLLVQLEKQGPQTFSNSEKRVLYATAIDVSAKVEDVCKEKGMTKDATIANGSKQRFRLKFLSTYSSIDNVDEPALAAAADAAVGAICDPIALFNEQRCIMSLPPVMALKNDTETKSLFDLLSIFQQGKLEDFQTFQTNNPDTLTKYSIPSISATRNMRLLSLCSLATDYEEIPYDAIASTLQVEPSDVESWVIDAVSSGLLDAKMNQLEKVVLVERCAVRRFGIDQWKILQKRIDLWKKNVRDVLEGLKSSEIGASGVM